MYNKIVYKRVGNKFKNKNSVKMNYPKFVYGYKAFYSEMDSFNFPSISLQFFLTEIGFFFDTYSNYHSEKAFNNYDPIGFYLNE